MKTYSKAITIVGQRWNTSGYQKTQEVHYRYEEKIEELLNLIQVNRVGFALLEEINGAAGRGKVKIWPPLSQQKRACYSTVPLHMKGRVTLKEANIEFVPSSFGGACPGVGTSPQEVLFHELVHASQIVRGVLDRSPIAKAPKMTDFSEFCAVTASNIYRSALGLPGLRAGHEGREEATDLTDSAAYYAFFRKEIDHWCHIQPHLCGNLGQMKDIDFNPLRARTEAGARP